LKRTAEKRGEKTNRREEKTNEKRRKE